MPKVPKPCDPEIYRTGEAVALIADRSAFAIQELVETIAELSGQRVDWHYVGGRGVVKCLGDAELVRELFRPYCNAWLRVFKPDGSLE